MTRPTSAANEIVVDRRRTGRRAELERRRTSSSKALGDQRPVEQRQADRRNRVERRRQIDPTTCERDYTPDQVDFMKAMDLYKRRSGRQFPTWSEVLEVIEHLGYRKVAVPTEIYKHAE
jgi:hypothetical protein